jgi:hypothetical protein
VLSDNVSTFLYASPHGVLVPSPWTPTGIAFNSEWAIIDDGSAQHAFSGVTGTFAPPLTGLFTIAGNEDVAFATGTPSYAYSPIQNAWTAAPAGTPLAVSYIRNGVIRTRSNGYDGFCARTGTWSSVNTTGPTSVSFLTTGATFCVYDSTTIGVFDSRLGRWSATPTVTTPAVSIWRFTLLANDGANAYGFAMTNNVWESIPLASPPIQMVANDSVGFVRTSTQIHMYSSLGSLSTVSRYPEFSRMQPRGSLIRYMQIGPPGAHVTAALATAGDYAPLPPLGTAFIDLNTLVGTVDLGTIPGNGVLDLSFLIPNDPALNNRALYLQDLIVPVSGSPYVTNSMSPIVM